MMLLEAYGLHPRQRLIEADILNPLSISHFLILPALFIFPLAFIVALPVMLLGLPVILLVEFVLIRQRILIRIMSFIERTMHWQIIHIPQAHRGNPAQERNYTEFSQHIEHFHKVPRGVFLGLFAYLIVHWIFKLDNFGTEIILSSLYTSHCWHSSAFCQLPLRPILSLLTHRKDG